jgi:uncharacterized protein (TIGR03083 family)
VNSYDVRGLLRQEIAELRKIVAGLDEKDLVQETACSGWHVADLVVHMRLGAESILQGLVSATEDPIDRDAVSYWADWPPSAPAAFSQVRWIWAQSSSYSNASALKAHFEDTAGAAQRAVSIVMNGRIQFQSHVMLVDDFLSMWVTELVIHHLDLILHLENRPRPSKMALQLVVATLQSLSGSADLEGWDEITFIRKVTGREALSNGELHRLGERQGRFPALG